MGKLTITLPAIPHLEQHDLPEGVNLDEAQSEFDEEFLNLTDINKELYFVNRMTFLKLSAEVLNSIKYGVVCVNCVVENTRGPVGYLQNLVSNTTEYSKSKLKQAWSAIKSKSKENKVDVYESSVKSKNLNSKDHSTGVLSADDSTEDLSTEVKNVTAEVKAFQQLSPKEKTDLFTNVLRTLNKIFYQNAKLASESIQYGLTIGIGGSVNIGAKKPEKDVELTGVKALESDVVSKKESEEWAVGALAVLLLHASYRPNTQTYVLNLETLTEVMSRPLTKVAVILGFDVRVGVNFKSGEQSSIIRGKSSYNGLGVFGKSAKSIYQDRIISWFSTEFGIVPGNDYMGFESEGVIVDLISVEGNELNPLFYRLGKASVFGKIYHFLKDIRKMKVAENKCDTIVF
jgi:hypothetical protein